MKQYYTDFARHCLQIYTRNERPSEGKEVVDWNAGLTAFGEFKEWECEALLYIYGERDTMEDNVYQFSEMRNIGQDILWELTRRAEELTAKYRGLI